MPISIRVIAKTAAAQPRTIVVSDDGGSVSCDCAGFGGDFCSHIDAVLVAQERAMVVADDIDLARRAIEVIAGRLCPPESWMGAWRKNLRWRGLTGEGRSRRVRDQAKPLVCFTGTLDQPRSKLIEEARTYGWETIDVPSPFIDVLVAADPQGSSGKLKTARKNGTPIITREEWSVLMTDGVFPA